MRNERSKDSSLCLGLNKRLNMETIKNQMEEVAKRFEEAAKSARWIAQRMPAGRSDWSKVWHDSVFLKSKDAEAMAGTIEFQLGKMEEADYE